MTAENAKDAEKAKYDSTRINHFHTGRQGRQPIQATARLSSIRSRWSLNFVKNFTIFGISNIVILFFSLAASAVHLFYPRLFDTCIVWPIYSRSFFRITARFGGVTSS